MTETTEPPAATEPEPATQAPEPKPAEKTALVPRTPMAMAERGVMLRSFEDLWRFAKMVQESGSAPRGMKTVGQVATAIQAGMEAGLTPMHALQAIVVINGGTSWRGQSAVGLIRSDPRCRYIKHWTEGQGDEMKGVCISRRVGAEREERTEFTVKQARTAGLWNKRGRDGEDTPWITYPDRQLMWRAVGFHAKDHWSDTLGGFPIDEEARDYAEELPTGPAPRPSLPPPSTPDPLLSAAMAATIDIQATVASADPAPAAAPEPEQGPSTAPAEAPPPPTPPAPCCGGTHGPSVPCPKAGPVIEESFLRHEEPAKTRRGSRLKE